MFVKQDAPFSLPFTAYAPQSELMCCIESALQHGNPSEASTPSSFVAAELPTGCGKTVALLSAVLRFQRGLATKSQLEIDRFFAERCHCNYCCSFRSAVDSSKKSRISAVQQAKRQLFSDAHDTEEGAWCAPELFFKHFRTTGSKRLRVETDPFASSSLKRDHVAPVCTIFYATRTHTQLSQAVRELSRFQESLSPSLQSNVLASRQRYCIHRKVQRLVNDKSLPVEGNNLGEVCDKLVAVNQCEMVQHFTQLASRSLTVPINGRKDFAWEVDDLVAEGVAQTSCPYYASRDLVNFANINFVSYQYLLDPVIRKECKFEGAVKNHSIIIFDEAHNVGPVCQDALSITIELSHLQLLISEVEVVAGDSPSSNETFAPSYPREFRLTSWTLRELFHFLHVEVLVPLSQWSLAGFFRLSTPGMTPSQSFAKVGDEEGFLRVPMKSSPKRDEWMDKFRQIFGIVMSLGVTFNPFDISIFGLGLLKRLLMVLRFSICTPTSYSTWFTLAIRRDGAGGETLSRSVDIRCLDGSLAFHHLAKSAYCVILASGTLAPMRQLSIDLKLPQTRTSFLETCHVINSSQHRLGVIRKLGTQPLRCTFSKYKCDRFLDELATLIVSLSAGALPSHGGVLVFAPNFLVAGEICRRAQRIVSSADSDAVALRRLNLFMEPRSSDDMENFLARFKDVSKRKRAVLFAVFRGKVSEGVDFTDDMARLVLCVGLPFQPLNSPSVEAQRGFSGEGWYLTDAVRAVNQALGRCIRHASDYGAMVLLDERFGSGTISEMLPSWCRDTMTLWETEFEATQDILHFLSCCESQHVGEALPVADESDREATCAPSDGLATFFGSVSVKTLIETPKINSNLLRDTALKLLCETVDDVKQVSKAQVKGMLGELTA